MSTLRFKNTPWLSALLLAAGLSALPVLLFSLPVPVYIPLLAASGVVPVRRPDRRAKAFLGCARSLDAPVRGNAPSCAGRRRPAAGQPPYRVAAAPPPHLSRLRRCGLCRAACGGGGCSGVAAGSVECRLRPPSPSRMVLDGLPSAVTASADVFTDSLPVAAGAGRAGAAPAVRHSLRQARQHPPPSAYGAAPPCSFWPPP